jgi:hypothetical protein
MALPRVIQLDEYASGELFELNPATGTRGPGTYTQLAEIKGNSILSSIFLQSIDPGATLKINYYDRTTGAALERYELTGHDLIDDSVSPFTTVRILVTRIHHQVYAEAVITGGLVKFGLYATVVSSTASDLDSALKKDGTLVDLLTDKGLPAMGLGDDEEFHFIPIEGGAVKITGNISVSELTASKKVKITLGPADTEFPYTFPAGTRKILLKARTPAKILLSDTAGDIAAGDYLTLYPGAVYDSPQFVAQAKAIFLQSSVAGLEIEAEYWT